ncbi:MAG: hypothetical protein H7Y18_12035 [Clostridiaceae bacterium]|nr:hypothetical protein [Clostridiaceae bacterium]
MLEDLFVLFVIYSFLGWLTEILYAFCKHRKFVNRGFLYGPFCPIYGLGVVLASKLLLTFQSNLIILFILSVIITSIIEYITSYILEIFFQSTWWDYSNEKFNIDGKICLKFSLLWGSACVFIVKIVNPFVENRISTFISLLGAYEKIILEIIFLYFCIDFIITLFSLFGFKRILLSLQNIKQKYNVEFAKLKENTQLTMEDITRFKNDFTLKEETIFNKITKNQRRLLKAFPYLNSKRYKLIEEIKKRIREF